MNDKPPRGRAGPPGRDDHRGEAGHAGVLRAVVLAPFRAVGWLIGWDSEGSWGGTLKTILYAVAIALVVRTFLYEPFNIPSGSMKPTLLVGDYLFVSKFSYGYSRYSVGFGVDLPLFGGRLFGAEPERGDVVVFRRPTDTSVDFIKRVIGLPGDAVQVIDGVVHIDGEPLVQEAAPPFLDAGCRGGRAVERSVELLPNGRRHEVLNHSNSHRFDHTAVHVVPEGHYFVMGNNRDRSNDSRAIGHVGFVPAENLIGRAEVLFFSADGCGSLFAPWTWPGSIRWDRFFQAVE